MDLVFLIFAKELCVKNKILLVSLGFSPFLCRVSSFDDGLLNLRLVLVKEFFQVVELHLWIAC